jgi:acetyl esterase/lipase
MRLVPPARSRFWPAVTSAPARALAWTLLLGVTGLLGRAEVVRPDEPPGVTVHKDLVYREAGSRRARLDLHLPEVGVHPAAQGRPVLVALHGGGWRGGSKSDYGRSLAPLVRRGVAVVAVDYQLSRPGAPGWPGNLDDVREALRWTRRHARDYSLDPGRVVLIGASAGAQLALLAALAPGGETPPVRAVIDFYGPADLAALYGQSVESRAALDLLFGGPPSARPRPYALASPVNRVRPGAPPVLIAHGGADTHVPLVQSQLLASALGRAGVAHRLVVVGEARHGFGLRAGDRDLVPDVLAFLDAAWGPGADAGR